MAMPLPLDDFLTFARRARGSILPLLALGGATAIAAASCGLPGAASSGAGSGGAGGAGTRSTGPSGGNGEGATGTGANGGAGGAGTSSTGSANGGGSNATTSSSTGGPAPVCGNHQVEAGEQCDDGNRTPGDRCSADCQTEHPDVCPGTAIPLAPGTFTITDDTTGADDTINTAGGGNPSCPAGTYPGGDLIYAVTPSQSGMLTASLTAQYDHHFVHVRTACPGSSDTACAYGNAAGNDTVQFAVAAGTVYFVIVDSWQSTAGPFTLTLSL